MARTNPTGKAILRASLGLFRQDQQMVWLPVLSAVASVVIFAVIVSPVALAFRHAGLVIAVAAFVTWGVLAIGVEVAKRVRPDLG